MSEDADISTVAISGERVDELVRELNRRLMLVTPEAINHLQSHGAMPARGITSDTLRAADGCCKPDGGTCCPNRRIM